VDLSIDRPGSRGIALAACLAIAAILVYQGVRLWIADALVDSNNPKTIARGVALEAGNGDAWDRLGRFHQWDFANPNPALAASEYLHAVHEDSHSAHYLMDLAGAYEAEGEITQAQDAWIRARADYPSSAEVEWNYGNFLLRQQETSAGYDMIHRAVETDTSFLPLAISRTWRSSQDINALLEQVLPKTPEAYAQALDFFASIQKPEAALVVWHKLLEMKKPLPISQTFPFFQALIDEDRSEEARETWKQALAAAGMPDEEPPNHSLVWNGNFEKDFLNGGLDWRWYYAPGVSIEFDAPPPGVSGRSVRLDFIGGMNPDISEPFEYVPVEPGHSYHFHAFLRTQDISTESGMRMNLVDPNHSDALDLMTDNLTASHPWTPAEADFTTGPNTHIILVRLRRTPSRLFDNKLSGSVWMADVSLVEAAAPEPAAK